MTAAALLAAASAVGFGVAGVFLRRGLQYAGPLSAALVSVTITTAFIWCAAALTAPLGHVLTWRVWPFLVAGLVAPGLARLFFFMGIHRIGVARAFSIMATTPLFAVTLAIGVLGERPSPMILLGALAVVAGGVLLAGREHDDRRWRRRDMIFPALGALGFALRDNLSRWGLRGYDEPLIAAATATLSSLTVMWICGVVQRAPLRMPRAGLRFFVLSGFSEGFAYLMMWRALAIGGVSVVSPIVNTHSIVAIVLAAIFLRDLERVTWRVVVATAVILAGVAVIMRSY